MGIVDVVVVAYEESAVELKITYSPSFIPSLAVNKINILSGLQQCSRKPAYELHATKESGKPYRACVTVS
jgi:hypothetical protein